MFYDVKWMKALFYVGAMLVLIGIGLVCMNQRIAGVILVCIGAAFLVIGFMGIRLHIAVNKNGRRRV